ncbi:MAG: RNA-binding S4 domain-containing protein [Alphaproteobacteria bacterium]|nr:RNA-binding S4 domain-containing protein [Alphaproteobacteria bacterium]
MAEGTVRIDLWLFFARLCKSRSLAARMCAEGLVTIDGEPALRASRSVGPGAVVAVELGRLVRRVRVTAPGRRRGPAPEARLLYEDLGTVPRDDDAPLS